MKYRAKHAGVCFGTKGGLDYNLHGNITSSMLKLLVLLLLERNISDWLFGYAFKISKSNEIT